ncbi:MAG TPA: acyl-CoA dehydrogenase family protein [Candidatus Acidoferrales bacterium]
MATITTTAKAQPKGGAFLIEALRPEDVFTPEELTDQHKLIGQTAEEFVRQEVLPLVADLEVHKEGAMASLMKKAGEVGLLGGGVPESYDGAGLDKISTTVLAEKVTGYGSFLASHGGHSGIGTLPIVYFGTEAQKKKYLPKLATGEWLSCYCLTEPHAGSDALAARTRADLTPDGKYYVLNGQKIWITNGGFADVFIIFAKVGGEKFSCFIVERSMPGVQIGPEEKKMGLKGSSTVPIFLENAKVPAENLLGEVGRGHIVAFNILNVGRFNLGAYCLGGSKQVVAESIKYAKERTAFGKAIAEFGLIRQKISEMVAQTFVLDAMIYRTAGMIDGALGAVDWSSADAPQRVMKALEEYAVECSVNKVYGSEVLDFVVDEAVQIFGGYGYHQDYPVERAYRDSRVNRIFEGTNEINRMLITGMLLKRAMSGALPLISAAQKIADEVLAGPGFEEPSAEPLAAEVKAVQNAKKIFLQASGTAVQKYMDKISDQQEVLAGLAEIVMEVYAMESATLRAQKMLARKASSAPVALAACQSFVYDAADRVEKNARTVLSAVTEGDMLRTQLAVLKRFSKREPVNTIALHEQIAKAAIEAGRYPF